MTSGVNTHTHTHTLSGDLSEAVAAIDWRFWSLASPAIVFSCGAILYTGEAAFPGSLTLSGARLLGSWLMIVGSEGGTLSTVIEIGRKIPLRRAGMLDVVSLASSVLASLAALLMVWVRDAILPPGPWVPVVLTWGPLVLFLAMVADFYFGSALEAGLYLAFKRRDSRRDDLENERDRLFVAQQWRELARQYPEVSAEVAQNGATVADNDAITQPFAPMVAESGAKVAQLPAIVAQRRRMTKAEWREVAAGMNGDRPADGAAVNEWLLANGWEQIPESTARNWAKV